MEIAKMKPENSKDESTKHDNVLELVLIGLLAALMGLAS
jgi:hypothetical protein